MQAVEIIEKKRDGKKLTREEIEFFVQGLVRGAIPDYQAAAWCMAVYFRGLDEEETVHLTEAMVATGKTIDLSSLSRPTVDKHSTGGVGDKTTLVVAPILAALGAAVAKMSGRGLGHTGGTLDKLESIPGFRTNLTPEEFVAQVERIGLAVAGQTAEMVPADGILYALRDVTGTVPSIPLIAASIMAKKIAAGAANIVLDVKYGSGALLPDPEKGRRLAALMRRIGAAHGRRVSTFLTGMEQPLGRAVGNALEVKEALATLRGEGPSDLLALALTLAAEGAFLAGLAKTREEGRHQAERAVASGAALERFRRMIEAQGGPGAVVDRPELLPCAKATTIVPARQAGYLVRMDAAAIGRITMRLGAGREKKGDPIDHGAGIMLLAKLGAYVEAGMPLAELHTNRLAEIEQAAKEFQAALVLAEEPAPTPPLFLDDAESSS
ncbi:MAG: thymidine phosphorylase [Bacillota bacterium]